MSHEASESTGPTGVGRAVAMPAGEQRTRLAKRFLIKSAAIGLLFFVFAVWGLVDAVWVYPERGRKAAEYFEFQYLQEAQQTTGLIAASVPEPVQELARLEKKRGELATIARTASGTLEAERAELELTRYRWLQALGRVGLLDRSRTDFDDAKSRLDTLANRWSQASVKKPEPLSGYDIPSQWVIMGVGIAGALWQAWVLISAMMKKYRFDAASAKLTLPGGQTIVPEELASVDKRKWDKFYVFLRTKPPHTLSNKEIALDLYRFDPLEAWVLEMERRAFPSAAEPAATSGDSASSPAANAPVATERSAG